MKMFLEFLSKQYNKKKKFFREKQKTHLLFIKLEQQSNLNIVKVHY